MHCQHLISVDCYILNNVIIDDVIHCHYHCVALFIVYIIETPLITYCTSICSSLHYYNNTLHSLCQYFFILFIYSLCRATEQLGNCLLREKHVFVSWCLCVCEKLQSYEYSKMRRCTIATAPSK